MASAPKFEQFMLNEAEEWESYIERLESYFEANDIASADKKRSVLLSVCGREAFALIRDLLSPARLRDTPFTMIVKTMQDHLSPQPAEIARRHAFYCRDQKEGESVAEFVAALRTAARHCDFKELETMLRDRLVCGLRDERTQRRLFARKKLSFQEAMEEALAAEAAAANTKAVRLARSTTAHKPRTIPIHQEEVEELDCSENEEVERLSTPNKKPTTGRRDVECASCGGQHARQKCKFREAQCRACGKLGHIARACYSQCPAAFNDHRDERRPTATTPRTTRSPTKRSGWRNYSKANEANTVQRVHVGRNVG